MPARINHHPTTDQTATRGSTPLVPPDWPGASVTGIEDWLLDALADAPIDSLLASKDDLRFIFRFTDIDEHLAGLELAARRGWRGLPGGQHLRDILRG